mgnify:FL=1
MKYTVHVKDISYGVIEVEAENEDQAKELADEQYSMGNTIWQSGEYELEVEEIKPPVRTSDAR